MKKVGLSLTIPSLPMWLGDTGGGIWQGECSRFCHPTYSTMYNDDGDHVNDHDGGDDDNDDKLYFLKL